MCETEGKQSVNGENDSKKTKSIVDTPNLEHQSIPPRDSGTQTVYPTTEGNFADEPTVNGKQKDEYAHVKKVCTDLGRDDNENVIDNVRTVCEDGVGCQKNAKGTDVNICQNDRIGRDGGVEHQADFIAVEVHENVSRGAPTQVVDDQGKNVIAEGVDSFMHGFLYKILNTMEQP